MQVKLEFFDAAKLSSSKQWKFASRFQCLLEETLTNLAPHYIHDTFFSTSLVASKGCLLIDRHGEIQGFQLVCSNEVNIGLHRYMVLRSVVCKSNRLSEKTRSFDRFGPLELVSQALKAHMRGREPWLLTASEGPVVYHRMSIPGVPVPESMLITYKALAASANFRLDSKDIFSVRQGSIMKLSANELTSWNRRSEPSIRRYIEECPDFGKGKKLVFAVPLPLKEIASIPISLVRQLWIKRSRNRIANQYTVTPN